MSGSAYYCRFTELEAVLGIQAAAKLVTVHGGTRIYVPERFEDDSPIVITIGRAAADALSAHIATGIGGLYVDFPSASASNFALYRRELRELASDLTLTEREITQHLDVHGRTVRRMRARLRGEREGTRVVRAVPRTSSAPTAKQTIRPAPLR